MHGSFLHLRVVASLIVGLLLWWMVLSRVLLLVNLGVGPTMSVERNHLRAIVGRTIELRASRCAVTSVCRLKLLIVRHRGVTGALGRHETFCLLGVSGMCGLKWWTLSV